MKLKDERRNFLKWSAGSIGAIALSSNMGRAIAETCRLTPKQTAGPFYPGENKFEETNDLTMVPGRSERASGEVIIITGRVLNEKCEPISDANVEIWQACESGKYNNPRDPNPAKLDPNFRYWGETYTNEAGLYHFKSIAPGAYPADTDWIRPPHIHFKITKLGYRELVTQMYFKGHPLNEKDLVLAQTPASERDGIVVEFSKDTESILRGNFEITLRSVR